MRRILLAGMILFAAACGAQADVLSWNVSSGNYGTASNWDLQQVPTATDEVRLNNGGTAIIPSGTRFADKLYAGRLTDGSGYLTVSGGSLTLTSELNIAGAPGTIGSVTLTGSSVLDSGYIKIGTKGIGTMSVGPSASVNGTTVYVGMYGPEAIDSCCADGTLDVSGTLSGTTMYLSANGGIGHLNLNGGTVNLSRDCTLNFNPDYTQRVAMITVNGSAGSFFATDFEGSDDDAVLEFNADAGGFTTLDISGGIDVDGASLIMNSDTYAGTNRFHVLMDGSSLTGTFSNVSFSGSQTGWIIYDRLNGDLLFSTVTNDVPLLTVSRLFNDNMVLQRDMDVPIWGTAEAGAQVTVRLDGIISGTATADASGYWKVGIGSHPDDGGQPHTLRISVSGGHDLIVENAVFGDVYIAAGQSNMQALLPMVINSEAEIAAADYPMIRQTRVARLKIDQEQSELTLDSNWTPCSPETANIFSAVGYFFARKVYQESGVPVGLLFSAWTGQLIEEFTSPAGMAAVPELSGMLQMQEQQGTFTNLYNIYNGMIAPMAPYGVRGVIWYQGESNASIWNDGDIYQFRMQALMRGWREKWGQERLPFYYVQLPNITTPDFIPLRDAQRRVLSEPDCGMAVTIDVGEYGDLHPENKQDVGYRLALWALAKDFGEDIVCNSPLFRRAAVEDSTIRITFDHVEGGLMTGVKDETNAVVEVSDPLENFEIAGADKVFTTATAVHSVDNTILLSSPSVTNPVYARYCYFPVLGTNRLYNTDGLPAAPFTMCPAYEARILSGSGSITGIVEGEQQTITADAPPAGQVFDRWFGTASAVNNLNSSTAVLTMPDHDVCLLATYRDAVTPVYTITVNGGYGTGTSQSGSIINIEANLPPAGQVFDHWSGATQTVFDVYAASTTLRMPSFNRAVTAVYQTVDDSAPVAYNQSKTTAEDMETNLVMTAIDVDSPNLIYTVLDYPSHGTLIGLNDLTGSVTYRPAADYNGSDSFTFTVSDGIFSATGTVSLTITPVNDAPVAEDQSRLMDEDDTRTWLLSAIDLDSTNLTYAILTNPAHGILGAINPVTLRVPYTPETNYYGSDSFTWTVSDGVFSSTGTVSLTIRPVNDAPEADSQNATTSRNTAGNLSLTATDIDSANLTYAILTNPPHGTLSGLVPSTGAVTYTPVLNYTGADSFTFTVSDGDLSSTGAVDITVRELPLPWVSVDIGGGILSGSTTESNGVYTLEGSGKIINTADSLQYAYQTLNSDGEIRLRILSFYSDLLAARFGVMMRDNLTEGSKMSFMGINGNSGYYSITRTNASDSVTISGEGAASFPNVWVRLVRTGDSVTAYKSTNGTEWTVTDTSIVPMAANCYVGICVAAGSTDLSAEAMFDSVTVMP